MARTWTQELSKAERDALAFEAYQEELIEVEEAFMDALSREPDAVCKHFEGPDCEVCTTGGVA